MLGIESDDPNNSLLVRFRDPHNNVYAIDLSEGLIAGLVVALMSAAAQLRRAGLAQPMTLTGGRVFTAPDGRAGLELQLENAVHLPVLFPSEAIPTLRRTLDELEHLAKQAPKRRAN